MACVRFLLLFVILGFAHSCMGDECDVQIDTCYNMLADQIKLEKNQNSATTWKLRDFSNGMDVSEKFCIIIGKLDDREIVDCVNNTITSCGDQTEKRRRQGVARVKKAETSYEFALALLRGTPCRKKGCPKDGTTFNELLNATATCWGANNRGELKKFDACRQNLPKDASAPKGDETKCFDNDVKFCGYPSTMSENAKIVMSFVNLENETCTFDVKMVNTGQSIKGYGLYFTILSMVLLIFTF